MPHYCHTVVLTVLIDAHSKAPCTSRRGRVFSTARCSTLILQPQTLGNNVFFKVIVANTGQSVRNLTHTLNSWFILSFLKAEDWGSGAYRNGHILSESFGWKEVEDMQVVDHVALMDDVDVADDR